MCLRAFQGVFLAEPNENIVSICLSNWLLCYYKNKDSCLLDEVYRVYSIVIFFIM